MRWDEYMIKWSNWLKLQRDRESQDLHFIALDPCRRHRQPWLQIELPRWAGSEVLLSEWSNVRSFSRTSQFCWVNIFEHIWSYLNIFEHMVNVMWMSCECHVNVMWMSCECHVSHVSISLFSFKINNLATSWCVPAPDPELWCWAWSCLGRGRQETSHFSGGALALSCPCVRQNADWTVIKADSCHGLSWILDLYGDEFKTYPIILRSRGEWNREAQTWGFICLICNVCQLRSWLTAVEQFQELQKQRQKLQKRTKAPVAAGCSRNFYLAKASHGFAPRFRCTTCVTKAKSAAPTPLELGRLLEDEGVLQAGPEGMSPWEGQKMTENDRKPWLKMLKMLKMLKHSPF